ncbi:MAG: phosphatidate cytidylyltransferase [Saprospiraceae bacterium]|nr:phosphatidate cytidylyltransferase [Saprospiraceae bacterium]
MRFSDISTRLYTAIVFTGVVIGGLMVNEWTYFLLILSICAACSYELNKILSAGAGSGRLYLSFITGILPVILGMLIQYQLIEVGLALVLGFSACWILLLLASGLFSKHPDWIGDVSKSLLNLVYIGIPCLLAFLLGHIHGTYSYLPLLGVIALIWANDTGAYLIGSAFGKHPLFPAVSPKKTVEGTLGGILVTIVLAYPLWLLNDFFTWPQWAVIAAITGTFGTIGDLVESKIKRRFNIKDSGNLLPGHGGFLDRFDSFLFVVTFVYLYAQLI